MIEEFLSFKHMAFVAQKDCLGIGVKRGMENFWTGALLNLTTCSIASFTWNEVGLLRQREEWKCSYRLHNCWIIYDFFQKEHLLKWSKQEFNF